MLADKVSRDFENREEMQKKKKLNWKSRKEEQDTPAHQQSTTSTFSEYI